MQIEFSTEQHTEELGGDDSARERPSDLIHYEHNDSIAAV